MTLNGLENTVTRCLGITNKDQVIHVRNGDGSKKRIELPIKYFRYAGDFIVITKSKNVMEKHVKPAVETFLKDRGLGLSTQKTKVIKLSTPNTQLDFLGYTFKYQKK